MKIALGIPHLSDKGGPRDASFNRLIDAIAVNCEVQGLEVETRVFGEPAPNHVWSLSMWEWAVSTGAGYFLTLQDDALIGEYFWANLINLLSVHPAWPIQLHNPHPVGLIAKESYLVRTTDMWIGVANVTPMHRLEVFLKWREILNLAVLERVTEDSLFAAYAMIHGHHLYAPSPSFVDHDTSLDSTYGHNGHANRKGTNVVLDRPLLAPVVALDVGSSFYGAGIPELAHHLDPKVFTDGDRRRAILDDGEGALGPLRAKYHADHWSPPRAKIHIATPTRGFVTPEHMKSILSLSKMVDLQFVQEFILERHQHYHYDVVRARSCMVRNFLETNSTHLLFIDDDIAFDPQIIGRMLACKKPIVAAPYQRRDGHAVNLRLLEPRPNGWQEGDLLPDGTLEILGAGLGLCLIERHVLETLVQHHSAAGNEGRVAGFRDGKDLRAVEHDGRIVVMLFELMRDAEGHLLSEDYSFYQRAHDAGIKSYLYVGPGAPVGHASHRINWPGIESLGFSHGA